MKLIDFLIKRKFVLTKSEARRLIEQGAIRVNGIVIKDLDYKVNEYTNITKGLI